MKLIIKCAGFDNLTSGKTYEVFYLAAAGKVGKVDALIEDDQGNIVYVSDLLKEGVPFCVRTE